MNGIWLLPERYIYNCPQFTYSAILNSTRWASKLLSKTVNNYVHIT